jgi:hypothetical protein
MKIESICENTLRIGNFTSSEIYRLIGVGKREMTKDELLARPKSGPGSSSKLIESHSVMSETALSYIQEKKYELRLQRSLTLEKYSRPALWGKFVEARVHNLLPTCYETLSNVTTKHPTVESWSGSQDSIIRNEKVMCDIKCYEPKNFCEYVDALTLAKSTGDLSQLKKDFTKEYWQLISNACIWGFDYIEAIVYMPYFSELIEIKEMAMNYDGIDQYKYRFIAESSHTELPYLNDGGYYKNLNIFRFEALQSDKDLLTAKVIEASKLLKHD